MSEPLLFVSPADGQVYKVTGQEAVNPEQIKEQIQHHQIHIQRLETELQKYTDLTGGDTTSADAADDGSQVAEAETATPQEPTAAQPEAPAEPETPAEPAQPEVPSEPTEPADTTADQAEPATDAAPADATPTVAA